MSQWLTGLKKGMVPGDLSQLSSGGFSPNEMRLIPGDLVVAGTWVATLRRGWQGGKCETVY